MLVCESQASGPRVAQRRAEILPRLTDRRAGPQRGQGRDISPLAAEGTIGGVLTVIQARLAEAKRKPLVA